MGWHWECDYQGKWRLGGNYGYVHIQERAKGMERFSAALVDLNSRPSDKVLFHFGKACELHRCIALVSHG
jgi:hypothetical protein